MKRRHLLWIVFYSGIGLGACATPRCPPPVSPQSGVPRIDTTKACASWRWIGIKKSPDAECPQVPGWKVSPLFEAVFKPDESGKQQPPIEPKEYSPREIRKVQGPEVIPELKRFCVYEIKGWYKGLRHRSFPPTASTELVRFDQDCAIISSSGGEAMDQQSRELIFEHFAKQVGRSGISPTFAGNPNVHLAFLDTHPNGDGKLDMNSNPPNSWHGYTLAQIARDLVCNPNGTPDDQCAAHVTTRLALPIVGFDPKHRKHTQEDRERGGFIGMQSQLAEAITEEVNHWREERSERRLVLNLSVAWDGELFGGLDQEGIAEVRAGTQAVYRALQYAAAHGALVLAAAGNKRTPCPQSNMPGLCPNTGPLLPAAWERGYLKTCHDSPTVPLVYAVGGVQSDGTPLVNARPGGMPRRTAYGIYTRGASSHPDEPTRIYVGSSIATAAVSSIAAVVWNSFPDLEFYEVMDLLDASGDDLGRSADFWFGASSSLTQTGPPVRRISLCKAVRKACAKRRVPDSSCPIQSLCPSWTLEELGPPRPLLITVWPSNSCQSWMFPQPEDYPCLGCPPRSQ